MKCCKSYKRMHFVHCSLLHRWMKTWKKWIISDNSRKFITFAPKIWIPHPPTVIPFLLAESCARTKKEQMSLKSTEK